MILHCYFAPHPVVAKRCVCCSFRFVQQTDVVCNAVAYTFKLTVGLNKPLLLNERFAEVVTVSQITSFETGGETSREVAKRPGIETSKGAIRPAGGKRPGSVASR